MTTRLLRRSCRGIAVGLLVLTQAAVAEQALPDAGRSSLRLHGFGTAGLAHSNVQAPWRFRRDTLQPAASAAQIDSRLGLQLNWQPSPQWEAVGQLVAKRLASDAPPAQHVEWAFLAHRPQPGWTLRLGRTSPDLFLLADYRNVGFAYPWVRPNVNFYGWISMYSLDGLDMAREWSDGSATWRAKLYGGASRAALPGREAFGGDIRLRGNDALGATVSRESGGLLFKLSYIRMRARLSSSPQMAALATALDSVAGLPLPGIADEARTLRMSLLEGDYLMQYLGIGASYDAGPWLLHAEWSRIFSKLKPLAATQAYTSVGYRTGPVTWFGMLGHTRPSDPAAPVPDWGAALTPVVGPGAAQALQAAGSAGALVNHMSRAHQTTWSLGLRWDVHPQVALKFQWDRFNVRRNGGSLWANSTEDPRRASAVSLTVDVVF